MSQNKNNTARPTNHQIEPKDKLLPKFTLLFFERKVTSALLWLVLIVFGAVSYATLLKHEGFPSVDVPIAIVNGTYFANDPAKVDHDVAKPISDIALGQSGVKRVQTQSLGNFFTAVVQFKNGVDAHAATSQLESAVKTRGHLPSSAQLNYNVPYFGVTGGDTKKIDDVISLYSNDNSATTEQLTAKANQAAAYLNAHKPSLVASFFVRDPFETSVNPATGKPISIQKTFDRYGERQGSANHYFDSVTIGVTGLKNVDVIKLDKQLDTVMADLAKQPDMKGFTAKISASNAPTIKDEISELQRVLLEGLVAVLVIGSIVIAVRASFITVIAMITVILSVLGVLYLIGYSLNVITLFAIILSLSLIVDDTIIMVEAIDASRRNQKTPREAIRVAIRKISRAMVAATFTAALSFAPLLFVSGILGKFIHAMPVTIISALLISLLVALIFIPLFARFLLLGKKQMGEAGVREVAANFEAKIARAICRPMLWGRRSTKKLLAVGLTAVLVGLIFIGTAGFVFTKVVFNIFPASKDTNALSVQLTFPANTTITQAEAITAQADQLTAKTLGANFENASYFGMANETGAMSFVNIISYTKRQVTSPELAKQLQTAFDTSFTAARASIGQVDVGPPSSAFAVQVQTEDRAKGYRLAGDIASYLKHAQLTRVSGKTAHFTDVEIANPSQFLRSGGKLSVNVTSGFDGTDTSTLVTLAQNAVKKEFPPERIASYGLPKDALAFDIGEESDNQDSFKTLAFAFPILMLVIYLMLALQFRSLLQPLLIFLAVPFSLFGVTLGLYLTHNAFSFFAAMGFFALIGLSLKNTILLTDYANQSRRSGMGAIDSAVEALGERFRPLVATSLTAVVSLIPLAITSPFWQGLAVVLIFGLLSSTLLVILVFPYYWLGGEFLRTHISRRAFFIWLVVTAALAFGLGKVSSSLIAVAPLITLIAGGLMTYRKKHRTR